MERVIKKKNIKICSDIEEGNHAMRNFVHENSDDDQNKSSPHGY